MRRKSIEDGNVSAALHSLRKLCPAAVEDPRLLFRLKKQLFVEALREDGDQSVRKALACAREELAPLALDAYPEAYVEFKQLLLLLVHPPASKSLPSNDTPGSKPMMQNLASLWAVETRMQLAAMVYQTTMRLLGVQHSQLSLLLRYLLHLHTSLQGSVGSPLPHSGLVQTLLQPAARDPSPLPVLHHPGGALAEADVQAVIHCAGSSRQAAMDALRHAGGQASQAFQSELARIPLDQPALTELVLEYATYRGLPCLEQLSRSAWRSKQQQQQRQRQRHAEGARGPMSEPRGGSTTNPTRQPGQCGRSSPRLHALADIHPELPASDACGMGVDGGRALLRVLDEGGGGARGRDCAGDGGLPSVAPASAAAHEPAAQAGKLSPNDREPHRPASGGVSGPWASAPTPPAAGAPSAQPSLPSTTSPQRPPCSRRAPATDRLTSLPPPGAPHPGGDDSSPSPPAKYARWSESDPAAPLPDGRASAVGASAGSQSLPSGACGARPPGSTDGLDGLTSAGVQGDASAGGGGVSQQQSLLALRQLAKEGAASAILSRIATLEPAFLPDHPCLHFDLVRCSYVQLIQAGDQAAALSLARSTLTPIASHHPPLLPALRACMAMLLSMGPVRTAPPPHSSPTQPRPAAATATVAAAAAAAAVAAPPSNMFPTVCMSSHTPPYPGHTAIPTPSSEAAGAAAAAAAGSGPAGMGASSMRLADRNNGVRLKFKKKAGADEDPAVGGPGGAGGPIGMMGDGGGGGGDIGLGLVSVVAQIVAVLQPRLNVAPPKLLQLLQALLATRRTWLQKEQMKDPFQSLLGIDRLCPAAASIPLPPPPPPPLPAPPGGLASRSFAALPTAVRAGLFAHATAGPSGRIPSAATTAMLVPRSIIDRVLNDYEVRHGMIGVPSAVVVEAAAAAAAATRSAAAADAQPSGDEIEDEELPPEHLWSVEQLMEDVHAARAGGGDGGGDGGEEDRMETDEESVLRLIEILEVPRSAAISLLQQHEGDVEMAVMSFLHG
ncbi:MAG: hypothetical protein WDW36_005270 [Sanguina aurantia]